MFIILSDEAQACCRWTCNFSDVMANKRQRLAKKRRAGGAVGQAHQTGDAVPTKKPLKAAPKSRKILKKHPLRVAGQKPGDGCFICQSTDHVAKACPQKLGKEKKMVRSFCSSAVCDFWFSLFGFNLPFWDCLLNFKNSSEEGAFKHTFQLGQVRSCG
ncbi:hypothetical protein L7F22_003405 [Adiantum nelumboides]|nr:hypothetical protein [Adiantum nelumboides]